MPSTKYSVLSTWCFARESLAAALIFIASASPRATAQDRLLTFPVSEPAFAAQLAGIDPQWNLSFRTAGRVRVLAAADLAYFGRYRDAAWGPQVVLVDGSIVRSDVLFIDGNQMILGDATGLGRGLWEESSLPRSEVRAILWQPPAGAVQRDRMLQQLMSAHDADDRLLLSGGETIAGRLVETPRAGRFAEEKAEAHGETFLLARPEAAEPLRIPAGKVVATNFGQSSQRAGAIAGMSAWLGLSDGSLVRAASVNVRGGVVTIALAAGGQLKTSLAGREGEEKRFWDDIAYIEPASPRVVWLSDLTHLGYKHIPFVSVERQLGIDQTTLDSRLRHGSAGAEHRNAVFRKGLGMPSASRVAYDVDGYRSFDAELAIDEQAGLKGSVVFKVLLEVPSGEWQPARESTIVRGGDTPVPLSVELRGAARMALLVEFADRGDECDYANWLHARLVK